MTNPASALLRRVQSKWDNFYLSMRPLAGIILKITHPENEFGAKSDNSSKTTWIIKKEFFFPDTVFLLKGNLMNTVWVHSF